MIESPHLRPKNDFAKTKATEEDDSGALGSLGGWPPSPALDRRGGGGEAGERDAMLRWRAGGVS